MVVEGSRDDDHFLDILTVSFFCQVMEQELKLQNPSLPVLSQRKSKNPWIFDTADLEWQLSNWSISLLNIHLYRNFQDVAFPSWFINQFSSFLLFFLNFVEPQRMKRANLKVSRCFRGCLMWLFSFYHGKSPLSHHLNLLEYGFLLVPATLSKSKRWKMVKKVPEWLWSMWATSNSPWKMLFDAVWLSSICGSW